MPLGCCPCARAGQAAVGIGHSSGAPASLGSENAVSALPAVAPSGSCLSPRPWPRLAALLGADRALFLQTWPCRTLWAMRSVEPPGSPCTTAVVLAGKKAPEGQWCRWGLPGSLGGPSHIPRLSLQTPSAEGSLCELDLGALPSLPRAVSYLLRDTVSRPFLCGSSPAFRCSSGNP